MSCGDSCNQQEWRLSNHIGTHMDYPFHFDSKGKRLHDYEAGDLLFQSPFSIQPDVSNSLLINLEEYSEQIPDITDCLFIDSGFWKKRSEEDYHQRNPGLTEESGFFLREKFPNIKVVILDFISLTSYQHRDIGRKAHKAFLSKEFNGEPILIVEDANLSILQNYGLPPKVIIAPLLVKEADGTQVNVLGVYDE